ncbi:MAG: hypothetical protein V4642_04165 [Bacteroidota bacterium]
MTSSLFTTSCADEEDSGQAGMTTLLFEIPEPFPDEIFKTNSKTVSKPF